MANAKGFNKNRNHHDSLSQSGSGRKSNDNRTKKSSDSLFDMMANVGAPKPYGKGKHSKGNQKPKKFHW